MSDGALSTRKVIVQITADEFCEICGLPPSGGPLPPSASPRSYGLGNPGFDYNVTNVQARERKSLPGDVEVKFYSPLLPPECETPEGEVITRLSLRKMQAMMARNAPEPLRGTMTAGDIAEGIMGKAVETMKDILPKRKG